MSDISSRVKAIIVDKLGVDENEVTPEASFTNDLGADSLDTVELIMEFEKEFNMGIPDDQAESISTVGDAIKMFHTPQAARRHLSYTHNALISPRLPTKRYSVNALEANRWGNNSFSKPIQKSPNADVLGLASPSTKRGTVNALFVQFLSSLESGRYEYFRIFLIYR